MSNKKENIDKYYYLATKSLIRENAILHALFKLICPMGGCNTEQLQMHIRL